MDDWYYPDFLNEREILKKNKSIESSGYLGFGYQSTNHMCLLCSIKKQIKKKNPNRKTRQTHTKKRYDNASQTFDNRGKSDNRKWTFFLSASLSLVALFVTSTPIKRVQTNFQHLFFVPQVHGIPKETLFFISQLSIM